MTTIRQTPLLLLPRGASSILKKNGRDLIHSKHHPRPFREAVASRCRLLPGTGRGWLVEGAKTNLQIGRLIRHVACSGEARRRVCESENLMWEKTRERQRKSDDSRVNACAAARKRGLGEKEEEESRRTKFAVTAVSAATSSSAFKHLLSCRHLSAERACFEQNMHHTQPLYPLLLLLPSLNPAGFKMLFCLSFRPSAPSPSHTYSLSTSLLPSLSALSLPPRSLTHL